MPPVHSFRTSLGSAALVVMTTISALVVRRADGSEQLLQLDESLGRNVRNALLDSHRLAVRAFAARQLLGGAR